MSEQSDNAQQPTHEAARVVIPFDIDVSAAERKIEELERRMKSIVQVSPQTPNTTIESSRHNANDGTMSQMEKQMLQVTLMNIYNTLRQINDFVQLIYTENTNGR